MDIQVDTNEKERATKKIFAEFDRQGIHYFSSKLYVGDYMNLDNPRLIVDRKQSLSELYTNLCHEHNKGKNEGRFTKEFERAKQAGIKVVLLCEHGNGIKTLEDVREWYNPRLDKTPFAWDGRKLHKEIALFLKRYDTEIYFCNKTQTGKRIIELLGGEIV